MANNEDFRNNLGQQQFVNPSSPGGYYNVNQEQSFIGGVMQDQLSSIMRSFKDELSFNMQSLNLTLSTLSNSMNNLSGKVGELGPNTAGRYITSGLNSGGFLGNVSQNYANFQPINSVTALGGIINSNWARHPFNVSPLEYYTGMDLKRGTMGNSLLTDAAGSFIKDSLPGMLKVGGAAAMFAAPYIGAPLAMAASFALPFIGDALKEGGGVYSDNMRMIRRMSGRFSPNQFNTRQSMQAARGLQELTYKEIIKSTADDVRLGMTGYRDVTMLGLQGDLFKGTKPEELIQQVEQTAEVVKVFTGILGSNSVKETMEALVQMKNMGMNAANNKQFLQYAKELGNKAFGYGYMNSMSTDQMLRAGMQIAQSGYGTYGIPSAIGINQGMQNLAYVNELRKRGMITDADIAVGGGNQSIASRIMGTQAQVLQTGLGNAWLAMTMRYGAANATDLLSSNGPVSLIGAGINSVMSGNPFANIAKANINRHNILASLQNGEVDSATSAALQKILEFNPIYTGAKEGEDRDSIGAYILSKYFNIDSTTAKALISKIDNPGVNARINYRARKNAEAAYLTKDRYGDSFSAQIYNGIHRNVENVITKGRQPIVRLGEDITDWFTGHRVSFMDYTDIGQDVYEKTLGLGTEIDPLTKQRKRRDDKYAVLEDVYKDLNKNSWNSGKTKNLWDYKDNFYPSKENYENIRYLETQSALNFAQGDALTATRNVFWDGWEYIKALGPGDKLSGARIGLHKAHGLQTLRANTSDYWDIIRDKRGIGLSEGMDIIEKYGGRANVIGIDNLNKLSSKYYNDPLTLALALMTTSGASTNAAKKASFDTSNFNASKEDIKSAMDVLRRVRDGKDVTNNTTLSLKDVSNAIKMNPFRDNLKMARILTSEMQKGTFKADRDASDAMQMLTDRSVANDILKVGTMNVLTDSFNAEPFQNYGESVLDMLMGTALDTSIWKGKPTSINLDFYEQISPLFNDKFKGILQDTNNNNYKFLDEKFDSKLIKKDATLKNIRQLALDSGITDNKTIDNIIKNIITYQQERGDTNYTLRDILGGMGTDYYDKRLEAGFEFLRERGFNVSKSDWDTMRNWGSNKEGGKNVDNTNKQNLSTEERTLGMSTLLLGKNKITAEQLSNTAFANAALKYLFQDIEVNGDELILANRENRATEYIAERIGKLRNKDIKDFKRKYGAIVPEGKNVNQYTDIEIAKMMTEGLTQVRNNLTKASVAKDTARSNAYNATQEIKSAVDRTVTFEGPYAAILTKDIASLTGNTEATKNVRTGYNQSYVEALKNAGKGSIVNLNQIVTSGSGTVTYVG